MARGFSGMTDDQFREFTRILSERLSIDPGAYGVSIEMAQDLSAAQADYETKYRIAQEPAARTKITVSSKTASRKILEQAARFVVTTVSGCPKVTDAMKAELGLSIRKSPVRISAPIEAPHVTVLQVQGRTVWLRLSQSGAIGYSKPARVAGARVFCHVGEQQPEELADWETRASVTTCNCQITLPKDVPQFSKVWITARWFSPRQEMGPASQPTFTYLGHEIVTKAA